MPERGQAERNQAALQVLGRPYWASRVLIPGTRWAPAGPLDSTASLLVEISLEQDDYRHGMTANRYCRASTPLSIMIPIGQS